MQLISVILFHAIVFHTFAAAILKRSFSLSFFKKIFREVFRFDVTRKHDVPSYEEGPLFDHRKERLRRKESPDDKIK